MEYKYSGDLLRKFIYRDVTDPKTHCIIEGYIVLGFLIPQLKTTIILRNKKYTVDEVIYDFDSRLVTVMLMPHCLD